MREARERECNTRAKSAGRLSKDITNMGKELERDQDKAGTDGAAFASSEVKERINSFNLYRVR